MSLGSPSSCTPGQYYKYMSTFSSGSFPYQGGGFNFGSTLSADHSGGAGVFTAYVYMPISDIAGLHIEGVYDFQSDVNVGFSILSFLNGIGLCPHSLNTSTYPYSNTLTFHGAWANRLNTDGLYHFWVGNDFNTPAYTSTFTSLTLYQDCKITIDVSENLGAFTYNVTTRLQISSLGIDQTCVTAMDNGGFVDGYIVVSGNATLTSDAVFDLKQLYITGKDSALGSSCLGEAPNSFTISSTKIKVKPFPTYEIRPAYSFVQNSSGYWKGTDRGAAQDIYIGNFTAEATDTNFNALQTTINTSREAITFSGFNTDLLAPNVDQSGSVVGTILDFGARKHLQFNGAGQSVFDINISFRALSPTVLSTTPSLSSLRLMENWQELHTTEIAKGQSLTQSYSYADRNSDAGRFVGYFSQTRAQTQAILAYILVTARAASFTFPTLSGVAYPFGISKGTGPFTVIIYDFKVTRQNLNRWTIMIDFRESV